MVSFRVFKGTMGRGKEDIISEGIKLSEYLNRELTVVVEFNSYAANCSELFRSFFWRGNKILFGFFKEKFCYCSYSEDFLSEF